MSKTHRHSPEKIRPRDIKRQRQREAMVAAPSRPAWFTVFLPEPEAPVWKPLG